MLNCSIMKNINVILIATISISLLAGCSTTPIKLDPVGPAPSSTDILNGRLKVFSADPSPSSTYIQNGWLKVFTATKTVPDGDDTYYYPHTGYRVYTDSGRLLKYEPNHVENMDESATLLKIPAGKYNVLARSEPYNMVIVPVVIQAGKTTEVHLGAHWKAPSNAPTNEIVYFPDGRPVGWKNTFTNSIN
jgi:hypothetical protein